MAFWWSFVAKDDAFEDIVCALGACFSKLPVDMEYIYCGVNNLMPQFPSSVSLLSILLIDKAKRHLQWS